MPRAASFECSHPDCTGNHGMQRAAARYPAERFPVCPAAKKRNLATSRKSYGNHRRNGYVYVALVDNEFIKIGHSTIDYKRQVDRTKAETMRLGLRKQRPEAKLIWHHIGDVSLEIFLQWRAGRIWSHLINGVRHSEWFDVTSVSPQDIVKHLRRWFAQVELLDQWDAEQQAATATLEPVTIQGGDHGDDSQA